MSAPLIISSSPSSGTVDVVLGASVVVGFDQAMDTTTINASTFSLTGPGQTAIIAPGNFVQRTPTATAGREYVEGTFAFTADTFGRTILTFNPNVPLRPNVTYTLLVAGLVTANGDGVKGTNGLALAHNYEWSFTTGDLNVTIPPAVSPLPVLSIPMDPTQIRITTRMWSVGNDLSQQIAIQFPGNIDPSSIDTDQILLSLEPILNDPNVIVPTGLTPTVSISGSKILITISGWPAS